MSKDWRGIRHGDAAFREAYGACWSSGDEHGFASEWTWSGTATGKLVLDGVVYPRTGKSFSVDGVAFCTVDAAGLVTSHKDYYDMRIVLKQLGLA